MTLPPLKYPFITREKKPLFSERVLFIPPIYSKVYSNEDRQEAHTHAAGPIADSLEGFIDLPSFFGNTHPVFIEYCSGNGDWVVSKAMSSPEQNWIAVEKKFDRVRKIWKKRERKALSNLLIVCGEALAFTEQYLSEDTIAGIYVNFPDPWPKLRHAKHRLFQKPFVEELSRIVKKAGTATFVTDYPHYCQQMIEEMLQSQKWSSLFRTPYYLTMWPKEWGDYGSSYFEELWRKKNCTIHYTHFMNTKGSFHEIPS